MDIIDQFISFLSSGRKHSSPVTIKNYKSDVRYFINWFNQTFDSSFKPQNITNDIIKQYRDSCLGSDNFESSPSFSVSTVERRISSLRKFYTFLNTTKLTTANPFTQIDNKPKEDFKDVWHLREFKHHLQFSNKSALTIKNYIIDIKQFLDWADKVTFNQYKWEVSRESPFKKITSGLIHQYKERLIEEKKLSPVSVNRKLSSLRKYYHWAMDKGFIDGSASQVENLKNVSKDTDDLLSDDFKKSFAQIEKINQESDSHGYTKIYSKLPPVRLMQKSLDAVLGLFDLTATLPVIKLLDFSQNILWKIKGNNVFIRPQIRSINTTKHISRDHIESISKKFYAPFSISTRYFPFHKKLLFHLLYTRPKWYKKYHSISQVHYFHLSILTIVMSAIGYGWYNTFIVAPQKENPIFASTGNALLAKTLSFQGRLTDSRNNPITNISQLRFAIYSSEVSSGSAMLWEENQIVTPDQEGNFSTSLGINNPISQNLFTQNSLWLGISVGLDPELAPRQQLATVSYAQSAQTLEGLLPITSSPDPRNTVLALDSSGNLTIQGIAGTTFQAIGGDFKLSGEHLILATNFGSNGNIQISPDGEGRVDIQKSIQNTSNSNNLSNIDGAVEIEDVLAIIATSSAHAALNINQNSSGPLVSAYQGGIAKFSIDNIGGAFFAGNVGINVASPAARLDIGGDASASGDLTLYSGPRMIQTTSNNNLTIGGQSTGNIYLLPGNGKGFLGLGTSSPKNPLDVLSVTTPQVRFAYDGSNYSTISVSNSGAISLDASGSSAGFTFSDSLAATNGLTTSGNLSLSSNGGSISLSGFGTTSISSIATTGNAINLADASFSPTTSSVANLLNLSLTTTPSNTSGTASTAGLNIAITNNASGVGGAMETYGVRIQDIAGIAGAGIQTNYGIRIGNQGQAFSETSYGLYVDSQTGSTTSYAAVFANGNVGIGTTAPSQTLDVEGLIQTSFGSSSSSTAVCHSGATSQSTNNDVNLVDCSGTPAADYMEMYPAWEDIETGDLVATTKTYVLTKDNEKIVKLGKTTSSYQTNLIGVVSDAQKAGDFNSIGYNIKQEDNPVPIALNGRAMVKVSSENGKINPGDYLTSSSSIPGIAMKATQPGPVIGKALESFTCSEFIVDGSSTEKTSTETSINYELITNNQSCQGKILVFVNTSWYDPTVYIADNGSLKIINEDNHQTLSNDIKNHFSLVNEAGEIVEKIGVFTQASIANLQTGSIKAQELTTNTLIAAIGQITTLSVNSLTVATDSIIIGGNSLEEYIVAKVQAIQDSQGNFVSPIKKAQIIETSFISPLSDNPKIAVKLENDKFSIVNPASASSSALFSLDASGSAKFSGDIQAQNASVSGQILASEVVSQNARLEQASIAGTLRAGKIIASDIDGLNSTIASIAAHQANTRLQSYSPATQSASSSDNIASTPNHELITNNPLDIASFSAQLAHIEDLSATFGRFDQGLIVLGSTSLADLSVADRLSVGAQFVLADNSINLLGADLELQPLRQGGVSLLAGLIHIDRDGNIKAGGNAEFDKDVLVKGNLLANFIKPIPDRDLEISLGSTSATLSNFIVKNASGSSVLVLDQKGNLQASGSARFKDLLTDALSIVRGAQADTSLTSTIASGSAGIATIIEGETQRTVLSPFVTSNSLIYLSPASDTQGFTPYIARQTAEDPISKIKGSFTIQISQRASADIKLNWWIVN